MVRADGGLSDRTADTAQLKQRLYDEYRVEAPIVSWKWMPVYPGLIPGLQRRLRCRCGRERRGLPVGVAKRDQVLISSPGVISIERRSTRRPRAVPDRPPRSVPAAGSAGRRRLTSSASSLPAREIGHAGERRDSAGITLLVDVSRARLGKSPVGTGNGTQGRRRSVRELGGGAGERNAQRGTARLADVNEAQRWIQARRTNSTTKPPVFRDDSVAPASLIEHVHRAGVFGPAGNI